MPCRPKLESIDGDSEGETAVMTLDGPNTDRSNADGPEESESPRKRLNKKTPKGAQGKTKTVGQPFTRGT